MSENRSLWARAIAKINVLAAREQGLEEELVNDTTSTHVRSSTGKKGSPIKVMRPETRKIMHQTLNGLEPVFKSPPINGGQGFFDVRKGGKSGGSSGMQEIAEHTDAIVSDDKLFHHRDEKRKRVLAQIEKEFRERNPEFYEDANK